MICWRWCRNWLSEEGFDQRLEQFLKCFFLKRCFTILSSGRLSAVMLEKIGTSLSPRISRNSTKRPSCGGMHYKKNSAGGGYANCTGALNFKPGSLRKSSLNLKIKRRGLNWKGQNPPCGQKVTPQKSIIRVVHKYSMIMPLFRIFVNLRCFVVVVVVVVGGCYTGNHQDWSYIILSVEGVVNLYMSYTASIISITSSKNPILLPNQTLLVVNVSQLCSVLSVILLL